MGTWGEGPFGSDTAADVLDELRDTEAADRPSVLHRLLADGALPEEILASAAVVAANLPAGSGLPWNAEVPEITTWLVTPSRDLRERAAGALATLPAWWWSSWKDPADRRRAEREVERMLAVLNEA
jgi:alpha-glucosidase